jgi:proteasome lid subunit RPN8/RPN11
MEGIAREVFGAFHAIPRRGAETGGVLLGHYEEDRICVEDSEPVRCEHRWGPSYIFSDCDFQSLEETLESCRTGPNGLSVVGFYRSHTRPDAGPSDSDRELFDRYFPDSHAVFLLLKPSRRQTIEADYYYRVDGVLSPVAGALAFPADAPVVFAPDEAAPQPELHEDPTPEPVFEPPPEPVPPRRTIPPPTRPRLTAPALTNTQEAPAYRDRRWIAALAVLAVGAGLFGFWSLGSRPAKKASPPAPTAPTKSAESSAPSALAPPNPPPAAKIQPPTPAAASSTPSVAPGTAVEPGVRAVLDQWDRALRTGNPKAIAAFYAPKIDSYFGERNVSSAAVARALARSAARYGKTTVLRLSAIRITPLADGRASATFRKRWQTSGTHVYAGETEERVTLAKHNDGWKSASEQELRVLWTERIR